MSGRLVLGSNKDPLRHVRDALSLVLPSSSLSPSLFVLDSPVLFYRMLSSPLLVF